MDLLKEFKSVINSQFSELNKGKVYLAISGGSDSVVLLHLLLQVQIQPVLLHCNFHLRGKESEGDEAFVKELANTHDVELVVKHFETNSLKKSRESTQMLARRLRYDWFKEIAKDGFLLTAHHLDDQLETFLINISRGTGLDGLKGIPARVENIRRPLLTFSKSQLNTYLEVKAIEFREDSSNTSDAYLRNRIRQNISPQLKEVFTDFEKGFSTTLKNLQVIESTFKLELRKERFWKLVHIDDLQKASEYDLISAFSEYGLKGKQISELHKLLNGKTGAQLILPSFILEKRKSDLAIVHKNMLSFECLVDLIEHRYLEYGLTDADFPEEDFEFEKTKEGAEIILPYGKKKVTDLLNDSDVPACIRESYPLMRIGNEIIGIPGYLLKKL